MSTNTHKYVPESALVVRGRGGVRLPVVRYIGHVTGTKPSKCPLIRDTAKVQMVLADGTSSWWGCERAYINSELRMCVVLAAPVKCELRRAWEDVPDDLRA